MPFLIRFPLAFLLMVAAGGSHADTSATQLSIESAFKPPSLLSVRLSPDGEHLVALTFVNRASAVIVMTADQLVPKIILKPKRGPDSPKNVRWINNRFIAIDRGTSTYIVDTDGNALRWVQGSYIRTLPNDAQGHERILMGGRSDKYSIHSVDLRTDEKEYLTYRIPGDPIHWIFNKEGVPVALSTVSKAFFSDEFTVAHWYRPSIKDKWEQLASFPITDVAWEPLYLTRDERALAVTSSTDRDTAAIYRYPLDERRIVEMMAGHPTEDIAVNLRDDDTDEYLRATTLGMKPEVHWFDARWASLQKAVDTVLPDRINWLTGQPSGRVLVWSHSDVDPGRWYLLNTQTMSMVNVAAARPDIQAEQMLPKQVVRYTAPDGLSIPAYLTLPRKVSGKLPAVVLVHGGPIVRDEWSWDPEVQMLASRGYAVLQPQFRGSTGFGKAFQEVGYKQWGLAMQDDVSAGARWLVSEGIADPARMCVYGASYGGYAALWALVKTPDLFQCAISLAGVTDLNYMYDDDSDVNESAVGRLYRKKLIGDPKTMGRQFDEVSPLKHVDAIKMPLLIAHGERDGRVPIEHSKKMVEALKKRGKTYQWIPLEGEGHGISEPANQKIFYQAMFDFLGKYTRASSSDPAEAASQTKVERAHAQKTD
jgi:dipeptidyl aminopeptidase/acylaminoacyl peptidase